MQCPVTELLDNPDHRGIYQTMLSQAAINVEVGRTHAHTVHIYAHMHVYAHTHAREHILYTHQAKCTKYTHTYM